MNGNVVVPAGPGGPESGSVSEVGCSPRRAAQVKYSNEYLSDTSSEVSEGFVRNYGHYDMVRNPGNPENDAEFELASSTRVGK